MTTLAQLQQWVALKNAYKYERTPENRSAIVTLLDQLSAEDREPFDTWLSKFDDIEQLKASLRAELAPGSELGEALAAALRSRQIQLVAALKRLDELAELELQAAAALDAIDRMEADDAAPGSTPPDR